MPVASENVISLQSKVWSGSLPLEIKLAAADCRTYDESETYLVQLPRLSYLAFILPRLHDFFTPSLIDPAVSSHDAWFSFEGVPLKWHYPIGLLYDLYSGVEPIVLHPMPRDEDPTSQTAADTTARVAPIPWKLTIHYSELPAEHLLQLDVEGRTMQDTFINNVKEADFIRNGTARTVMSLGKEDSDNLWIAVQNRRSMHMSTSFMPLTYAKFQQTILHSSIQSTTNCSIHQACTFVISRSRSTCQHQRAAQPQTLSQRMQLRVTCELCNPWCRCSSPPGNRRFLAPL